MDREVLETDSTFSAPLTENCIDVTIAKCPCPPLPDLDLPNLSIYHPYQRRYPSNEVIKEACLILRDSEHLQEHRLADPLTYRIIRSVPHLDPNVAQSVISTPFYSAHWGPLNFFNATGTFSTNHQRQCGFYQKITNNISESSETEKNLIDVGVSLNFSYYDTNSISMSTLLHPKRKKSCGKQKMILSSDCLDVLRQISDILHNSTSSSERHCKEHQGKHIRKCKKFNKGRKSSRSIIPRFPHMILSNEKCCMITNRCYVGGKVSTKWQKYEKNLLGKDYVKRLQEHKQTEKLIRFLCRTPERSLRSCVASDLGKAKDYPEDSSLGARNETEVNTDDEATVHGIEDDCPDLEATLFRLYPSVSSDASVHDDAIRK